MKITKIQNFYNNSRLKIFGKLTICKHCGKIVNSKLSDVEEVVYETCDTCKKYNKWYRKFRELLWKP